MNQDTLTRTEEHSAAEPPSYLKKGCTFSGMEVTKQPTRGGNTHGAFFTEVRWHRPRRVVRF
jgi:hypothetical protein